MASRFVVFATDSVADYTVSGVGFKYIELSRQEAEKILQEAAKFKVTMEKIEKYSHEEYGSYESVEEVVHYEFDQIKSLSEKIWKEREGAADIIVVDGEFFGAVFFTGFTDYRGLEEYGFIPIASMGSREGLTNYTSVELSILKRKDIDTVQATWSTGESESASGRSSTSWRTNFYLVKK